MQDATHFRTAAFGPGVRRPVVAVRDDRRRTAIAIPRDMAEEAAFYRWAAMAYAVLGFLGVAAISIALTLG